MSLLLLFGGEAAPPPAIDEATGASLWRQWQIQQQMLLVHPTRNDEAPGAVISLVVWVVEAGEASGTTRAGGARAGLTYQVFAGGATPEWPTPQVLFGATVAACTHAPTGDAWLPTTRAVSQIEVFPGAAQVYDTPIAPPTGDVWLLPTRIVSRIEVFPGPARVHAATSGAPMALHCEMKPCRLSD
jgi:hypothetical protein